MPPPSTSTALLVVRAWSEPGADVPNRYSVRWTNDVALGLTDERSFSAAGAAAETVRAWLEQLERR